MDFFFILFLEVPAYRVREIEPAGISVSAKPTSLKFKKVREEKKFKVTLKAKSCNAAGACFWGKQFTPLSGLPALHHHSLGGGGF